MNKFFYPRLAAQNLKKNKVIYLPYLLSSSLIVALFYILGSITVMVVQSKMAGSGSLGAILMMSTIICGFLDIIILFYINSFVMKRRKKEFGLYSILGMEKRHITLVMFWEVLLTGIISLVVGIGGGALLSQLLFLVLLNMVHLPPALTFQVPMSSVAQTAVLFAIVFVVVFLFDVISIRRSDPIALLHAGSEGEREPKARWILALTGFLALGGGYGMALSVTKPSDVIGVFFLAVLLVIIGTYALLIAGSIVVLKIMRKNKNFYYKPKNFISVSGMIYRMKQNAAGLASICILSTAVLVTMSSTVCLFIGEEDTLKMRHPRQVTAASIVADDSTPALMRQTAEDYAAEKGFTVENYIGYYTVLGGIMRDGDALFYAPDRGSYVSMEMIPLDDFNAFKGADYTLAPGEALVWSDVPFSDEITIGSNTYRIKERLSNPDMPEMYSLESVFIVLPDLDELRRAVDSINEQLAAWERGVRTVGYRSYYDVSGDEAALQDYYDNMRDAYTARVEHISTIDNIDDARTDFYQIYGGLLFVGLFFVTLFIAATVLIIYYKQITEGYDDHDRFQIMRNVGMSDREIKSTVGKQVLMVFFLPLGMAVLHISVAFPVLCKLLQMFDMDNIPLFLACLGGTVLFFALIYSVVYKLTARTYFKIVRAKEI